MLLASSTCSCTLLRLVFSEPSVVLCNFWPGASLKRTPPDIWRMTLDIGKTHSLGDRRRTVLVSVCVCVCQNNVATLTAK